MQGVPSPERWGPQSRKYPEDGRWGRISCFFILTQRPRHAALVSGLTLGRLENSLFSMEFVSQVKWSGHGELEKRGFPLSRTTEDWDGLPIAFSLLERRPIAKWALGRRDARCPKLQSKMKKWRIKEPRAPQEIDEELATVNKTTAVSAGRIGGMTSVPELRGCKSWSTPKGNDGSEVTARVLSHGTNGNFAQTATHMRDQERSRLTQNPRSASRWTPRRFQSTMPTGTRVAASLSRVQKSLSILWYTFEVCSASCCWWVASSIERLTQYATSWLMLLADNVHLKVGGAHFRPPLLAFFLQWRRRGLSAVMEQEVRRNDHLLRRLRALADWSLRGTQ